jgi:hypothetical protein
MGNKWKGNVKKAGKIRGGEISYNKKVLGFKRDVVIFRIGVMFVFLKWGNF